jgi:NAD(P)-dependent dehydrogenase (short-subunit alcohol dehydrogenase family)
MLLQNIGGASGNYSSCKIKNANHFLGINCSCKAALHMLGDTLRLELAPFGVQVVTVCPS